MTTDAKYINSIKKMTYAQLLNEVIENPTYLSDRYYTDFGNAIKNRHCELKRMESQVCFSVGDFTCKCGRHTCIFPPEIDHEDNTIW